MVQSRDGKHDEIVLAEARSIINARFKRGKQLTSAHDARELAVHELAREDQEVFACLFLDNRNRVLVFEHMFFGTIDRSHVHPRIIAKRALDVYASAVILVHNHPSGDPEPSNSDRLLTDSLKECLTLFEIRVLDHIVVGGTETYSFAEHGLM